MRTLVYLLASAAFLLNPSCERSSASYLFGMAEVRSALAGTWTVDNVTFRIEAGGEQHASEGWIRSAAACDQRTLIASANACYDETLVPLRLLANGREIGTGSFRIVGEMFTVGSLDLDLDGKRLDARITASGDVKDNGTLLHVKS